MTSQMNKLNSPLTKFSFQGPTNTEYFPVENFIRRDPPVQNFELDRTPTKFDSGFNEVHVAVITTLQFHYICPVTVEQGAQLLAR